MCYRDAMLSRIIVALATLAACNKSAADPKKEEVVDDIEVVSDPSPSTWVEHLPSGNGKMSGGVDSPRTRSYKGWFFDRETSGVTLSGAYYVHLSPSGNYKAIASFEISVEQGKVRLYYADDKKGYRYIEATPGTPARVTGYMLPRDPRSVVLEAVDGDAQGVHYRFWRVAKTK
jgi:hypothetical protein